MAEGSRMWAISLLTLMLLIPLLSAAPLDIASGVKDDDGMHSHDENVTRGGKFFGHNQFDIGNISVSGSVAGDVVSIGHEVDIDVQGHHDHEDSVAGDVVSIGHEVDIDVQGYHDHEDGVAGDVVSIGHYHEDDAECKEGLSVLFKSIDSNKDGQMDAEELLRVFHQIEIQIPEYLAVRILTLSDKTVGFNLSKFCELLKDCPCTNRADFIYFLLQLYDKGELGATGDQGEKVTCHYKDDLSSVLLENNWRTQDEIDVMSEEDKRNTVLVEVEKMTGHTTEDLQRRANAEDLGSLASIANMAAFLIKYLIRSSSEVKTMTYEPDLRNTLLVEISQRFSTQIGTLQSMTDHQLLKKFFEEGGKCGQCKCGQTDAEPHVRRRRDVPEGSSQVICPYKDDLDSVIVENKWRTQNEITQLSEGTKRNIVIIEVMEMTGHTAEDLQGRSNAGKFGSLTAIANMAALLIKYFIRSSSHVKTLTWGDLRNILIVETSQRYSIPVRTLQSMTDTQLLERFCIFCTGNSNLKLFTCPSGIKKFTSTKSSFDTRLKQNCEACHEKADGCSGWKIGENLDKYFRESCVIHDLCYTYRLRRKFDCDTEQFYNMLQQCGSDSDCRRKAIAVLAFHRTGASTPFFVKAQLQAIWCTKTKN